MLPPPRLSAGETTRVTLPLDVSTLLELLAFSEGDGGRSSLQTWPRESRGPGSWLPVKRGCTVPGRLSGLTALS